MTWINTRTSPWHIHVTRMHLVLFPMPFSSRPRCKCRCCQNTVQIHTHKYQLRAQNTHILLFARYTCPKYQIHPPHLLGRGRDATADVPPWLDLPTCGFRTWVLFLRCRDSLDCFREGHFNFLPKLQSKTSRLRSLGCGASVWKWESYFISNLLSRDLFWNVEKAGTEPALCRVPQLTPSFPPTSLSSSTSSSLSFSSYYYSFILFSRH